MAAINNETEEPDLQKEKQTQECCSKSMEQPREKTV